MSIQILGKRILIKKESKEEKMYENAKKAGIVVEEKKEERKAVERGEILRVGNELEDWEKMIGQKVIFNSWAGDEIQYDNRTLLVVHVDDIIAVYK